MNGNFNIDTVYVPLPPLSVSPYPVDELPSAFHIVSEPIQRCTFHYDLNVFGDQPANILLFIQKMEEDLQELKKQFLT